MAEPTPSPVAETGSAARSASSGAAAFLKGRTFGMPRYVFLGLLAAGIGFGLWYRYRQANADATAVAPDPTATDLSPDSLANNTDEPGLAGVGVAGVAPGEVVPVTTPTLPEGYPDSFSALTSGLIDLAGEFPSALDPPSVTVKPNIIVKGAKGKKAKKKPAGGKKKKGATRAHASTGGGPPSRPAAAHHAPKKKKK